MDRLFRRQKLSAKEHLPRILELYDTGCSPQEMIPVLEEDFPAVMFYPSAIINLLNRTPEVDENVRRGHYEARAQVIEAKEDRFLEFYKLGHGHQHMQKILNDEYPFPYWGYDSLRRKVRHLAAADRAERAQNIKARALLNDEVIELFIAEETVFSICEIMTEKYPHLAWEPNVIRGVFNANFRAIKRARADKQELDHNID